MNDIAAILLAAGRSRRMGAFKPLLPFGDRTVIGCCISNIRAAGIEDVIVVVGHQAEEVRQHLQGMNVSFAVNPDPDSEMSASILCGLQYVGPQARALLIALVDHPAVPPQVVALLVDQWRHGAKLVQPEYQGHGGHPVLIDLAYGNDLAAIDPRRGLRGVFDLHRAEVRRVPVESPYVARDMDTWKDYQRLHVEVFGSPPPAV